MQLSVSLWKKHQRPNFVNIHSYSRFNFVQRLFCSGPFLCPGRMQMQIIPNNVANAMIKASWPTLSAVVVCTFQDRTCRPHEDSPDRGWALFNISFSNLNSFLGKYSLWLVTDLLWHYAAKHESFVHCFGCRVTIKSLGIKKKNYEKHMPSIRTMVYLPQ